VARVAWSPAARRQFNEIVAYIARGSPPAAFTVHQKVLRATRRAGQFPFSAPWIGVRHPELSELDQTYRMLVVRPYIVLYRVAGDYVLVLVVQHGAQLLPPSQVLQAAE
jgi:plasmid stabilization system protein ParE